MESSHILIVEDEQNLGATLKDYLQEKDFSCTWADNATEARKQFEQHDFQVVLMDIELPDGNGLELARQFREKRKDFVLLFLSAQNDPDIRVEGLEIGAQDYITKPFALKELTLRLGRIIETASVLESMPEELVLGDITVWPKRYEIKNGLGEIIPLSQKECAIFEKLYRNKNEAVERDKIIDHAWGQEAYPSSRTVDNYIVKLRKIFETDSTRAVEIQSIRGVGYKLVTR